MNPDGLVPRRRAGSIVMASSPIPFVRPTAGRSNRLLAMLPPPDYALLAPSLREVALEQGTILYDVGDIIERVYFPHGGMISLLVVLRSGETIDTATVGREGMIGATAGLGSRFAVGRAVVQLPGTASEVSFSRFHAAVARSGFLRDMILRYNELLIAQIQQSVACNALHDVEARLCRWLLTTSDRVDSDTIPFTQDFLAQMLGVRRTTVTMVARMLQSAGIIQYRRRLIQIVDRKGLEATACECYGTIRQQMDQILPPKSGFEGN